MAFPSDNSGSSSNPGPSPGGADGQAPQAPAGAPVQVAESGNTATHSCIEQDRSGCPAFQVVWQGLDTLEISYRGHLHEKKQVELQALKELAQSSEAAKQAQAQIQIGERIFEVGDRGGGRMFAFLLRHTDMRISLSSSRAKRMPLAVVAFQNEYLIGVGPTKARDEALSIAEELGDIEGIEFVSRCDIAADICTSQDIGAWGEKAWITHATNLHRHTVDGVFTGWSIGLGANLSARLYDKLLEIRTKSGKTYFEDLWTEAGWFPGDPVKRLELQLRRSLLEEFGVRSVKDVLDALPGLWKYAVREWTRLAVPNAADVTVTRWPVHPFWERVQEIPWSGSQAPQARYRARYGVPKDKILAVRFRSLVTSIMARDGLKSIDEASSKLKDLAIGDLVDRSRWEGASTDALIEEAVALKRRKYCVGLNQP